MPSTPDYLLYRITGTARLLSTKQVREDDCLNIDALTFYSGYPAGLAFPDILYCPSERVFAGLSFEIAKEAEMFFKSRARLDDKLSRVSVYAPGERSDVYPPWVLENGSKRLEIQWTRKPKLRYKSAQLNEVRFWFQNGNTLEDIQCLLEVNDVVDILQEYDLVAPPDFGHFANV